MKTVITTMLSASMAFMLSACTTVGVGVANFPTKFSSNKIVTDVTFGSKSWQKLDVYIPANVKPSMPVIVFTYGGRWQSGFKEMYAFIGDRFADQGFVTVIADYRKFPEVKFPTFVTDAAKALAWVDDHIGEYGGDSNKIFVSGHSSGAHTAALITADERYLAAEGKSTKLIKAFAGISGPYDFVPEAADIKEIFAPPENYFQMQVPNFIRGSEPPMLLLWGSDDKDVVRTNLDKLLQKCQQQGVEVETKIYPGVGHIDIVANQTWFYPGSATIVKDITDFFNKQSSNQK